MKILVAVDNSGSVVPSAMHKVLLSVLHKLQDKDVSISTFDHHIHHNQTIDAIMDGTAEGGGGSDITEVIEAAKEFDYTYVITDGYIDDLDKLPHNSEVVLVGEE